MSTMVHFLLLKRRKLIVNVTSIYYNIKKLYLIIFKDLFLTCKLGEIVPIRAWFGCCTQKASFK